MLASIGFGPGMCASSGWSDSASGVSGTSEVGRDSRFRRGLVRGDGLEGVLALLGIAPGIGRGCALSFVEVWLVEGTVEAGGGLMELFLDGCTGEVECLGESGISRLSRVKSIQSTVISPSLQSWPGWSGVSDSGWTAMTIEYTSLVLVLWDMAARGPWRRGLSKSNEQAIERERELRTKMSETAGDDELTRLTCRVQLGGDGSKLRQGGGGPPPLHCPALPWSELAIEDLVDKL